MALQYFLLFIDGAVLPAPHDLEVLRGWGDEAAHLRDDRLDKLVFVPPMLRIRIQNIIFIYFMIGNRPCIYRIQFLKTIWQVFFTFLAYN